MKREDYLKANDLVKVAQNHPRHPNRKGFYLSTFWKSPAGTTETYDYLRLGDEKTGEWFEVRFEHVIKLVDGKPVPFVEEPKKEKKKSKAKKQKKKKEYPDREIEWGQWIRYDLNDDTTVIRPHASTTDRYANTRFETEMKSKKMIKKRWAKHIGWAVRPKFGDVNTLIFVNSLEQAENYPMPLQPQFAVDEEPEEEVVFESYF